LAADALRRLARLRQALAAESRLAHQRLNRIGATAASIGYRQDRHDRTSDALSAPANEGKGEGRMSESDHDHSHDHHEGSALSPIALRVRALESLLVEKGYVEPAALDALIETYEHRIGPKNGAMVVARSWVDPEYRRWLLDDATAAIASLGFTGRQGEHMVAVANAATRHNLVVCTLCSCYPWPILGVPPVWYKSPAYRSRAVIDPRGVLAEFGLHLPAEVEVTVWDSTAEVRYLVVPERPAGSDGLDEAMLARLVTRDSMIGTGLALTPGQAHAAGLLS
jgi:nitrile hydratase